MFPIGAVKLVPAGAVGMAVLKFVYFAEWNLRHSYVEFFD
jgi:hypothetical protein